MRAQSLVNGQLGDEAAEEMDGTYCMKDPWCVERSNGHIWDSA